MQIVTHSEDIGKSSARSNNCVCLLRESESSVWKLCPRCTGWGEGTQLGLWLRGVCDFSFLLSHWHKTSFHIQLPTSLTFRVGWIRWDKIPNYRWMCEHENVWKMTFFCIFIHFKQLRGKTKQACSAQTDLLALRLFWSALQYIQLHSGHLCPIFARNVPFTKVKESAKSRF